MPGPLLNTPTPSAQDITRQVDALQEIARAIYLLTQNELPEQNGQIVPVTIVATGATYTAKSTDYVIVVNQAQAVTVKLPASPETGRSYRVKDGSGNASVHNITLNGNGNTLDGAATKAITTNYGSFDVTFSGTEWNLF